MLNISHTQLCILYELVRQAKDPIHESLREELREETGIEVTIDSLNNISAGLEVYLKDAALLEKHDSMSHGTSM